MNTYYRLGLALLIVLLGIGTAFLFLHPKTQQDTNKLHVVVSFYPLYYFTQYIGGNRVEVQNITPAGTEPHDYEPTARDIADMESSQLIILNGHGFEPWSNDIKQTVKTNIINATNDITSSDPHAWLNPVEAKTIVDTITTALQETDPTHSNYYQSNADTLKSQLEILDTEYQNNLQHCRLRTFVTSHNAFSHLAQQYNLDQVSIAGLSPDEEPSPRQIADIASLVKEKNIGYIFFERLISPKLSETIAKETNTQTLVLDPIEGISAQDQSQGHDYVTLMRSNLSTLKRALGCQ